MGSVSNNQSTRAIRYEFPLLASAGSAVSRRHELIGNDIFSPA